LDFGLAKALEPTGVMTSHVSMSPTITTPAMVTGVGVMLGTAAYMSPEQAKGQAADKRSDIWAYGCVLYEILAGRPAFGGETLGEVLAAILRGEPDWQVLPAATPASVRNLLRRCLRKDKAVRLRDAGDARIEILDVLDSHAAPDRIATTHDTGRLFPLMVSLAAVIVAAVSGVAGSYWIASGPAVLPPAQLAVPLPLADRVPINGANVAVSPDGSRVAYVAIREGTPHLFVRALNGLEARIVPGTDDAFNPFFSADGQWVGFFTQGKLKKVSLSGGAPNIVCDAGISGGASWAADDTIVFSPSARSGLWRVSAAGGTAQPLTTLDTSKGEFSHRYPQILPGGKAVLFTNFSGLGLDESQIELLQLDTKERRVLIRGGHTARFLAPEYLVYYRAGTLLASPFNVTRLEVSGAAPVTIAEGVLQSGGTSGAAYSVSTDGRTLAYVPASATGPHQLERRLVWIDRQGRTEPIATPLRNYSTSPNSFALSPDGRRAAVTVVSGTEEIWIYDLTEGTFTRLTSGQASRQNPVWSVDGKRVVYGGAGGLYWRLADGSGAEQMLIMNTNRQQPSSWSPDGRVLAFMEYATTRQIWTMPVDGDRQPRAFLRTSFNEVGPMFSPDGHWLAYGSDESGSGEVYVQPYPGPGRRWHVSIGGGENPRWNPNGRELFYRNGDKTMVADITTAGVFSVSTPRVLYQGPGGVPAPDGQRFLAVQATEPEQSPTQIQVLLNWQEELKHRMRAK
jgi:serine/threonine-protein kinase